IVEENNYYPFGLQHTGYNDIANSCRNEEAEAIKYNGKEYEDNFGLNMYEYGARNYDPAVGRFMNVDPLSDKYPYQSHYNFSENRVIDGRELEGLEWENFRTAGKKPGDLKMKLPSAAAQKQHY